MGLIGDDIVIIDIEYRDGEYIFYQDQTRCVLPGDKSILYLGTFQNIEKEIDLKNSDSILYGYTRIYLKSLTGIEILVAMYK